MGIAGSDYELVEKNIMYDEYPSPVIIDLRNGSSNFTKVKKTHVEDFNRNPKKKEASLPSALYNTLRQRIKQAIDQSEDKKNLSANTVNLIRNAFFDTIVSLFIGYNQFIITDDDGETTFNIKSFIESKSEASKDFYDRFFPSK